METEIGLAPNESSRAAESGAESAPFTAVTPVASAPPVQPVPPLPTYPGANPYGPGANPYGYQPYPPYGYGYPPQPTGTNGFSIASFVLGICGFAVITSIVGFFFGLFSLSTIKRTGQRGKGLAISGIVLSSVWMAAIATLVTIGLVTAPDDVSPPHRGAGGDVVGKGVVPIFDLHLGDCFTLPPGLMGSTKSAALTFTVAPCSTPHDSEAVGSSTLDEDSYPGADTLRAEGASHCIDVLNQYLPDTGAVNGRIEFVYPDEQAWGAGVHRVVCFLQFPDATLTQSVHRDRSSYTADQLSLLDATRPVITTVGRFTLLAQSATLADQEQAASDITTALRGEITALTTEQWPADVQPAIDALVAAHTSAAGLWAQTASAPGTAAFQDDLRRAEDSLDLKDMVAARSALGLASATSGADGSTGSTAPAQQSA